MIAWQKLKLPKPLPRILVKMAKATLQDAQERQVRQQVYQRDGLRCFYPSCRRRPTDMAHIKARSLGGKFVSSNLLRACRAHHQQYDGGLLRLTGNPDRHTLKVHVTELGRLAGIRLPRRVA